MLLIGGFYFDSLALLFWFESYRPGLLGKGRIPGKNVGFLGDLKTPKTFWN